MNYKMFEYEANENGITITKYTGSTSVVTIPSEIDGIPVKKIEHSTFKECSFLTSVVLPNNGIEIAEGAFSNCPSVEICVSQTAPDLPPPTKKGRAQTDLTNTSKLLTHSQLETFAKDYNKYQMVTGLGILLIVLLFAAAMSMGSEMLQSTGPLVLASLVVFGVGFLDVLLYWFSRVTVRSGDAKINRYAFWSLLLVPTFTIIGIALCALWGVAIKKRFQEHNIKVIFSVSSKQLRDAICREDSTPSTVELPTISSKGVQIISWIYIVLMTCASLVIAGGILLTH